MVGNVVNNILGNNASSRIPCAYCGRVTRDVDIREDVANDYLCEHCYKEWKAYKRRGR